MQNYISVTSRSSLALNPVKAWACTSGLECCPNSATLKDPPLDRTSWNTEACKELPLMRQRTPAHGMTCTACWESGYKYKLALPTLQAGKRLPVAVPEGLPSPKHAVSRPVAGNTYCLLQHWEDSDQDQRLKHLLLLSVKQFLLADYRLLLIPSECVCRMWSFHWGTREPKSQILKGGVTASHWKPCPS